MRIENSRRDKRKKGGKKEKDVKSGIRTTKRYRKKEEGLGLGLGLG